ncbi:hypothetical protein CCHL11_06601 [Colletotrichum chlorophyti]|uniref:Uncharacterized protein n=1 Tax=Colletotrichum chlorophyti TaxID=708187 RepID=A0A1Q8RXL6_9PEZI|nr:hypothetical protein CCHL11_06601 [Colletotrichum chlorophyti]
MTLHCVAPISGYSVFVPEWEIQLPGGTNVSLNGTVEEIFGELSNSDPILTRGLSAKFADEPREEPSFQGLKRSYSDFSGAPIVCNTYYPGNAFRLWQGIRYLYGITGRPYSSAGPSSCGRVSCSWRTAIWWCNDVVRQSTTPKRLRSFSAIANGALRILNYCRETKNPYQVSGQVFHRDGWDVIVTEDSLNC